MSAEEEAEMAAMLDLSKKKKKKKKKDKSSKPKSADGSPGGDAGASEAEMAEQRTLLAVDEEMQEGGPANWAETPTTARLSTPTPSSLIASWATSMRTTPTSSRRSAVT